MSSRFGRARFFALDPLAAAGYAPHLVTTQIDGPKAED
jgi:hypothetical protein